MSGIVKIVQKNLVLSLVIILMATSVIVSAQAIFVQTEGCSSTCEINCAGSCSCQVNPDAQFECVSFVPAG